MNTEFFYTPNECHIFLSLVVAAGKCEDPECHGPHGLQIHIQWLWWGVYFTWGVEAL